MTRARVIGAGLTGLATTWCLLDAGFTVELIDAADTPGGLIHTTHTPHGLVERGANAFIWTATTARWFGRLRLEPSFPLPTSRRRFLFRDGRARRWPLGIGETAAGAARLALAAATRSLRPRQTETIADWVDRVAGHSATTWLVGPALQGIYATSPDRLSAAAILAGFSGTSATRSASAPAPDKSRRGRSVSPTGGMGEFVERLFADIVDRGASITFGHPITSLDPNVPTVVCTDVTHAATLIDEHAPALARAMGALPTTRVLTATAFFAPSNNDLHGFGVLFPRGAGIDALGVLFNTDIFAGRGTLRSETWIYGAGTPAAGKWSDGAADAARVMATIVADRAVLTGHGDTPLAVYSSIGRGPLPTLPVYSAGVLDIQRRLDDLPPWLALAGNYLGRLGVAKLLDVAEEAAARLRANVSA